MWIGQSSEYHLLTQIKKENEKTFKTNNKIEKHEFINYLLMVLVHSISPVAQKNNNNNSELLGLVAIN